MPLHVAWGEGWGEGQPLVLSILPPSHFLCCAAPHPNPLPVRPIEGDGERGRALFSHLRPHFLAGVAAFGARGEDDVVGGRFTVGVARHIGLGVVLAVLDLDQHD
jgi:hypothetical protein